MCETPISRPLSSAPLTALFSIPALPMRISLASLLPQILPWKGYSHLGLTPCSDPGWSKLPCAGWSVVTLRPCISKASAPASALGETADFAKQLMRGSLPGGMQGMGNTGSQGPQKHRIKSNHLKLLVPVTGLAGFSLWRAFWGAFVAYNLKHFT